MTLKLHNTLSRRKEEFVALDPKNVRMYVCGPTVYDFAHIGNARPVIVFDVVFRLLRHLYGEAHVTYVRNITDIDDKINARAQELAAARGISVEAARAEITAKTAQQYNDDVAALGCLEPTDTPRATDYVAKMVTMIESLISSGHAYVEQGHVLFDVASKPDYGKLAHRSLDEMIAGARVDVAPYKRGAMDFVLWKPSDDETPGWESPWGRGRPGWHIECSAMGEALLGDTFDIHGGGIDLMFPHHENEIAQSECAHAGRPLARYWMHNGFLNVEGEKMSKSLGNFVTIRDLANEYPRGAIRLTMLQTHYRQPINWTQENLEDSWLLLREWALSILMELGVERIRSAKLSGIIQPSAKILSALLDDLNTPSAITALHDLYGGRRDRENLLKLYQSCEFLGLFDDTTIGAYLSGTAGKGVGPSLLQSVFETQELLKVAVINGMRDRQSLLEQQLLSLGAKAHVGNDGYVLIERVSAATIDPAAEMIAARNAARKAKNFKESDRIRDELLAKGIQLKDNPDGTTTWDVKR